MREGLERKQAVERAEMVFAILDVNHDGSISEDEFILVCMDDPEMIRMLHES